MDLFNGATEPPAKKRAISKNNGDEHETTFRPIFGSATGPPNMKVYLDYNATTPLEPSVLDAIFYSLKYAWGNPSSSYSEGKMAKNVIDESRNHVARMINSNSSEIIFTSGGTEANNMVFHSVIQNFLQYHNCLERQEDYKDEMNLMNGCSPCPHVITCNIEHDSVVLALRALKSQGKVEVTEVPVSNETGQVHVADVTAVIQWNTVLVSIMLANNETGVIQVCEIQVCLENCEKNHIKYVSEGKAKPVSGGTTQTKKWEDQSFVGSLENLNFQKQINTITRRISSVCSLLQKNSASQIQGAAAQAMCTLT